MQRDIGHHVMELEVHLHKCLLHTLDTGRRILDKSFFMAKIGPEARNILRRTEAGSQQSELVQLLKPLGIIVVGLVSRHLFDVAGVHQEYLKTIRFEDLKEGI